MASGDAAEMLRVDLCATNTNPLNPNTNTNHTRNADDNNDNIHNSNRSGNNTCPICLSEIEPSTTTPTTTTPTPPTQMFQMTTCTHKFCTTCLVQYLTQHKRGVLSCAVCKAPMCDQDVIALVGQEHATLILQQTNTTTNNNAVMFAVVGAQDEATFRRIAQARHFRVCTACSSPIEKNGGCDNMQCRCGHRFRWSQAPTMVPCNQIHFLDGVSWHKKVWAHTCSDCVLEAQIKLVCWRGLIVTTGLPVCACAVPVIVVGAVLVVLFVGVRATVSRVCAFIRKFQTQRQLLSDWIAYKRHPTRFPYGFESHLRSNAISKDIRRCARDMTFRILLVGNDCMARGHTLLQFRNFANGNTVECTHTLHITRACLARHLITCCAKAGLIDPHVTQVFASLDCATPTTMTNFRIHCTTTNEANTTNITNTTNTTNNATDTNEANTTNTTNEFSNNGNNTSNANINNTTNNNTNKSRSKSTKQISNTNRTHIVTTTPTPTTTLPTTTTTAAATTTTTTTTTTTHLTNEMKQCVIELLNRSDVQDFVLSGKFLRLDENDIRNQCVLEVLGYGHGNRSVCSRDAPGSSSNNSNKDIDYEMRCFGCHELGHDSLAAVLLEGCGGVPKFDSLFAYNADEVLISYTNLDYSESVSRLIRNAIIMYTIPVPRFDSKCDADRVVVEFNEHVNRMLDLRALADVLFLYWCLPEPDLGETFDPEVFRMCFPAVKPGVECEGHVSAINALMSHFSPHANRYLVSNTSPDAMFREILTSILEPAPIFPLGLL